jgi:hypothetical protein
MLHAHGDAHKATSRSFASCTRKVYATTSTFGCMNTSSATPSLGHSVSTLTTPCDVTTRLPAAAVLHQLRRVPRLLVSRLHGLYLNRVMRRRSARLLVGLSHWLSPCARSLRLAARLLVVRIAPALLRLCCASERAVSPLDFSSVGHTGSRRVPGHSVVCRDYPSRGRNGYTSPTPRVQVPRHLAWLVACLVAPLVVDYFAYAACPGASARHATRRRLLHLCRASGCRTSHGSSRRSSSTLHTPRVRVR